VFLQNVLCYFICNINAYIVNYEYLYCIHDRELLRYNNGVILTVINIVCFVSCLGVGTLDVYNSESWYNMDRLVVIVVCWNWCRIRWGEGEDERMGGQW
jgi:hypothetical protein